jgi:hypothetical protein
MIAGGRSSAAGSGAACAVALALRWSANSPSSGDRGRDNKAPPAALSTHSSRTGLRAPGCVCLVATVGSNPTLSAICDLGVRGTPSGGPGKDEEDGDVAAWQQQRGRYTGRSINLLREPSCPFPLKGACDSSASPARRMGFRITTPVSSTRELTPSLE